MTDIISYGIKFQFVSVLQIMADPITKFFLSRYGGLGIVGLFEMATRLVIQTRVFLSSITINLLPKLVNVHITRSKEEVNQLFTRIFKINYDLFAIAFGMLFLFSPIVLKIWLGEINQDLVLIIRILTIAWFINSLMIVPYIYNLGSGDLRGNIISHSLVAFFNMFLGGIVVILSGPAIFFIYSWIVALVVGSFYILVEYARRNNLSFLSLLSARSSIIIGIILLNFVLLNSILRSSQMNTIVIYIISVIIYVLMALIYFRKSESSLFVFEFMASFSSFFNKLAR